MICEEKSAGREIDECLAMYRDSHQAVARYSLLFKADISKDTPREVVATGLSWGDATKERDERTAALPDRRFAGPMYSLELENPEEAREAVRRAAEEYWARRRAAAN